MTACSRCHAPDTTAERRSVIAVVLGWTGDDMGPTEAHALLLRWLVAQAARDDARRAAAARAALVRRATRLPSAGMRPGARLLATLDSAGFLGEVREALADGFVTGPAALTGALRQLDGLPAEHREVGARWAALAFEVLDGLQAAGTPVVPPLPPWRGRRQQWAGR